MFIRWKNRQCKDRGEWHRRVDLTLSAYLVKSVRVDGKPRQKVVAFLASTRQFQLDCPYTQGEAKAYRNRSARYQFWKQVNARLGELVLTEEETQTVSAQLAQVVPPLSEEELRAYEALVQEEVIRNAVWFASFYG